MWAPVDFYTKAKTSVPVLLYTTEQICVAQFFVQLFRRWHARIVEKEDVDGDGDVDTRSRRDEVEIGVMQRPVESHGGVV
jgi:sodium/bile acid cotransporter 7